MSLVKNQVLFKEVNGWNKTTPIKTIFFCAPFLPKIAVFTFLD